MRPDDSYLRFEHARYKAMALTDHFRRLSPTDAGRPIAWTHAMQQTEQARQLLEAWLRAQESSAEVPELGPAR